jgi:hypothetical protein
MDKLLHKISGIIMEYEAMPDKLTFNEGAKLQGLMKNLSSNLYFLENERDKEARSYYKTIHNLVKDGASATGAEKEAKHQHPEKRYLDRVIGAGYRALDAMRSNQSFLKKEN